MKKRSRTICIVSTAAAAFTSVLFSVVPYAAWMVAHAESQLPSNFIFKPKPTTVLGSTEVGAAEAFTRIFNQTKGELAIKDGEFLAHGGLSFNWSQLGGIATLPEPIMGYMTRSVGSDIIHMVIRINRERSSLPRREMALEFVVAEGTTLPIPPGTVFGGAYWRIIADGIAGHGGFIPGLLPAINEEASTLTFLLLPGVVQNPTRPSRITIQYKFTSVDPPDGSPPLIYTPMETIQILPPPP